MTPNLSVKTDAPPAALRARRRPPVPVLGPLLALWIVAFPNEAPEAIQNRVRAATITETGPVSSEREAPSAGFVSGARKPRTMTIPIPDLAVNTDIERPRWHVERITVESVR